MKLQFKLKNVQRILKGSILEYLLKHSATLFVGLVCLSSLALVDFYFIGRIGAMELAAVSFAAPVVFLGINILLSLGVGVMIVGSKLVGQDDLETVNKLSSAGIYLALVVGVLMMLVGYYFHENIFSILRADPEIIELIAGYMQYIYFNFILMALLIVLLKILQSFGEVKIQAIVMVIVVILNIILDPLLIFGYGPFPELGLEGASIATCFATGVGVLILFIASTKYISYRPSSITFRWRQILYLGLPVSLSKSMMPLSNAAITAMLASFGNVSVAAYGIGYRIDLIVLLFLVSLSSIVSPFIGQNIGAGNFERIERCISLAIRIIFIYGIIAGTIVFIFKEEIANIFSPEVLIEKELALYLMIAPIGYFLQGLMMLSVSVLETLNKPMRSALVNLIYFFVLYIPFAALGAKFYGNVGIFIAYPVAGFIAAVFAYLIMSRSLEEAKPQIVSAVEMST